MDHLNLAHRSHRKAEYYTKWHHFSEAIIHLNKTLEYLEKAIISTRCDNIRSSLIVQRNFCHKQIECTKRRLENKIKRDKVCDHGKATMNMDELDPKPLGATYQELFHVMQEHNELLNCLIDQKQPSDVQSTSNSPSRASPTSETLKFKSGARKPKEDKEVIEELKTVNDKLRRWVHHLVESLERAQQEVHQLKDENGYLRKELTTLKTTSSSNNKTNKTIPELPPLEPPKLLY